MIGPTAKRIPLVHNPSVIVDAADYERVMAAGPWHFGLCGGQMYAQRTVVRDGKRVTERLHTFLTGWSRVDHINGNGLDNRRSNLRPATAAQNNANSRSRVGTSGYRGVSLHRASGRWRAYVCISGRQKSLGYFDDPADAARARDAAALETFGEFARLNFPTERAA